MAKKYLFVFILALQCNISAYIFAQKLPKIFQKPVTQLPDTNKKKPTENLLNLKEKADFMPKFLPIHFDFLAEIAPQNPQDSTQKQNITQKNQQENRKNAFASRTQIGVGNYGNSLIKNRTESPVLWENWRFFAEIFYQNSKYGAVARKASGNHFFHTQIGAEFAKNYKYKYLKVTTYILVKNHENRFYNYKPELLSNNNADTLVQRFVQNSFHLSFLYVDTIKKQTLEGEIKLQSWQKLPNQNISKVTERTSGFRLKYNKKLHTDKNKDKNVFYRFIQQLEFTSALEFWAMPRREDVFFFKRNFLQLSPTLMYKTPNFPVWIEGGVRLSYDNDDIKLYKRLHFYPNFSFLYQIHKDFQAKILYNGQTMRNTIADFTQQNAWIEPNSIILHTQQRQNIRLKLHYQHQNKQKNKLKNYQLYGEQGFAQYQNLPFWINSPADSAKFSLVYDRTNVMDFKIGGQYFYYTKKGILETKAELNRYIYQTNTQSQAWHLPTYRADVEVRFTPHKNEDKNIENTKKYSKNGLENMKFWGKLHGEFGRRILDMQTKEQNLSDIIDVSFGGEYLFFPKTSAYLSFFNVLNQKNPLFGGYISQGFHFLVGITHDF